MRTRITYDVEQSMIVFSLFPLLGQSQRELIFPGLTESLDGELFSLGGIRKWGIMVVGKLN